MSEEKKQSGDLPPAFNAKALSDLNITLVKELIGFLKEMIKAGRTNLLAAYTASIMGADLWHSAGILSDNAYQQIDTLNTIFTALGAGSSAVAQIFGALTGGAGISAFQPSLKTLIEVGAEEGVESLNVPGKGSVKFREKDGEVEVEEEES